MHAGIAQWLEQHFCKVKVVGSNPSAGSIFALETKRLGSLASRFQNKAKPRIYMSGG